MKDDVFKEEANEEKKEETQVNESEVEKSEKECVGESDDILKAIPKGAADAASERTEEPTSEKGDDTRPVSVEDPAPSEEKTANQGEKPADAGNEEEVSAETTVKAEESDEKGQRAAIDPPPPPPHEPVKVEIDEDDRALSGVRRSKRTASVVNGLETEAKAVLQRTRSKARKRRSVTPPRGGGGGEAASGEKRPKTSVKVEGSKEKPSPSKSTTAAPSEESSQSVDASAAAAVKNECADDVEDTESGGVAKPKEDPYDFVDDNVDQHGSLASGCGGRPVATLDGR